MTAAHRPESGFPCQPPAVATAQQHHATVEFTMRNHPAGSRISGIMHAHRHQPTRPQHTLHPTEKSQAFPHRYLMHHTNAQNHNKTPVRKRKPSPLIRLIPQTRIRLARQLHTPRRNIAARDVCITPAQIPIRQTNPATRGKALATCSRNSGATQSNSSWLAATPSSAATSLLPFMVVTKIR